MYCRQARTEVEGRSVVQERPTPMISYFQFCAAYLRARYSHDEQGASLVEYALLVALIAVVCLVAIAFLGQSASQRFSNVGSSIANT
jgi:pilus assembly protein Flp/PilA